MTYEHEDGEHSLVFSWGTLTFSPSLVRGFFLREFWVVLEASEDDLFWLIYRKDIRMTYWGPFTVLRKLRKGHFRP